MNSMISEAFFTLWGVRLVATSTPISLTIRNTSRSIRCTPCFRTGSTFVVVSASSVLLVIVLFESASSVLLRLECVPPTPTAMTKRVDETDEAIL
ncbi:hypothetical protein pipiens_014110 [Culex pipiens pipiens]|uniref:Secreted protein n=1 Tax=Culex pipiens pipiens TaxID=38569 RepID=A0ABD1CVT0_CULPP